MTKIEGGNVEKAKQGENDMCHPSCVNESPHKFFTTSLKTKRRKLITVDSIKYTLKFINKTSKFKH
jgi:hypothetical protein